MNGFMELLGHYDVFGAFLVNLELTLWSALFSTVIGVVLVVMRISPISSLRAVAGAYVELFKNLPLTIIMVFMVLGAYAQLKLSFSDTFATNFFWLAVTGLSLYTAAFVCESLRSGINTVPIGQAEAARALGLGFMQSATEIILPQAFRRMLPALGNNAIAILKDSSLISAIGLAELAYAARTVAGASARYWEPYITISCVYWVMTLLLARGIRRLEARLGRGDNGIGS